jgi:hypothetical protein
MALFPSLRFYFILSFWLTCFGCWSQDLHQNSSSKTKHINGTITATNNGISIIPSFSLGRPAVFFDLSLGGERLSFDPMLRFGMDGKPWSFVFWGRYKIIKDKKFTLTAGAHPAFLFREREVLIDGKLEKMLVTQRFIAFEIAPSYKISSKTSIGIYYLQGNGFNPVPPKTSHYLALNSIFNDIPLVRDFRMRFNPQLFYLRVDENDGTYVNSNLTISKKDFPISVQTIINRKIKSDISGDDLVWNVSLAYSFANKYQKNKY